MPDADSRCVYAPRRAAQTASPWEVGARGRAALRPGPCAVRTLIAARDGACAAARPLRLFVCMLSACPITPLAGFLEARWRSCDLSSVFVLQIVPQLRPHRRDWSDLRRVAHRGEEARAEEQYSIRLRGIRCTVLPRSVQAAVTS